jgi:prephenate dehydratase
VTRRIGYQGEPGSYSHRAVVETHPGCAAVGYEAFDVAFDALASGEVDRLVLPIENSTTGSVLEVLDRLATGDAAIIAEHRVEVRHALLTVPGTQPSEVERVHSHPEALAQARRTLRARGWQPVPAHDTAGAVRLVAERACPADAALGPPEAGVEHGLEVAERDVVDLPHNTTRFVVLHAGPPAVEPEADKSSIVFSTRHEPGALAEVLASLAARGADLTRIESRPGPTPWTYRFFVDLVHAPGPNGAAAVLEPAPGGALELIHLGSYRAVVR